MPFLIPMSLSGIFFRKQQNSFRGALLDLTYLSIYLIALQDAIQRLRNRQTNKTTAKSNTRVKVQFSQNWKFFYFSNCHFMATPVTMNFYTRVMCIIKVRSRKSYAWQCIEAFLNLLNFKHSS